MGESLRRRFDLTRDRILPESADYCESSVQKKEAERTEVRETRSNRRRTVLRSIIDDPTCICGARHVPKTGFLDRF